MTNKNGKRRFRSIFEHIPLCHRTAIRTAFHRGEQCHFRGWTMAFQRVDNALHGMNNAVARDEQYRCTAVTVPRNRCHSASEQVPQCLRTGATVPPHGLYGGSAQPVSSAWNKLYRGYETHRLCLERLLMVSFISPQIANLRKSYRSLFVICHTFVATRKHLCTKAFPVVVTNKQIKMKNYV